jgi:hypothetical protein
VRHMKTRLYVLYAAVSYVSYFYLELFDIYLLIVINGFKRYRLSP